MCCAVLWCTGLAGPPPQVALAVVVVVGGGAGGHGAAGESTSEGDRGTGQGIAALVVVAFASAGEAAVQYIRRTTKAEQRSAWQGRTTGRCRRHSMGQRSAGVEFATTERSAGRWRIMQHSAAQGDAGDTAGQRRMVQETQRSTMQGVEVTSRK